MDYINIDKLKVFAHHGVFDEEKENGQIFYVSAKLGIYTRKAGLRDDLSLSINYADVCETIINTMQEYTFDLIEAAAEKLAYVLLKTYTSVENISLTIHKPHAPVNHDFEDISVTVNRRWHTAYLGIGSNMGDKEKYITTAIESMKRNGNIIDVTVSNLIETKPYGYEDQANFLNGAICIKTLFSPNELLAFINLLEKDAKRVRNIHWGPRTLDIDILFYDNDIIYSEDLIIPHPELQKRAFVLEPMCELNPYYIHPLYMKPVSLLLEELKCKET